MNELKKAENEKNEILCCDLPMLNTNALSIESQAKISRPSDVENAEESRPDPATANIFIVPERKVNIETLPVQNDSYTFKDRRASIMSFKSNFMNETMLSCFLESVIPLTLAGLGQICAGLYLDYISDGTFFTRIPEAMALVTPLLNLKGNLEMNFASRLATYCHTGSSKRDSDLMRLSGANHGLSQTHTTITSLLLALICILINLTIPMYESVIFVAATILTASLASFAIETVLLFVIILARWLKINPDNVATPIAATVGDVSTLFFYTSFGALLVHFCSKSFCVFSVAAIVLSLMILPFYIRLAASHPSTRQALIVGWFTLMISAIISSGGGFILQRVHSRYHGFALLQPIIVGLVGNMCGIQASRLGSALHVRSFRGTLKFGDYPNKTLWGSLNPFTTFFSISIHSKTAILMVMMSIPSQLIFALIALFIGGKSELITWKFCLAYCVCCFLLVTLFMYLCRVLVHVLWRLQHDPDYSVIPLITALCDFTGSLFLFIVFMVLEMLSDSSKVEAIETFFTERTEQYK